MWFDEFRQDARFAFRSMRRRAGFTVAAVLTLALGIGATTAVFTVVDAVLLKRLPVAEQERLLAVWTTLPERSFESMPFTYASYEDIRDRLHTTSGIAAYPYHGGSRVVAHRDGEAVSLQLTGVTGGLFDVLRVRPVAGRLFATADDHVGAAPVLVLSSSAAERIFGGARSALGRRLRVRDKTFTVTGIAPSNLEFPRGVEAWAPATQLWASGPPGATSLRDEFRVGWYMVVRVAPEFTLAQARADLEAALADVQTEAAVGDRILRTASFADVVVGDARSGLLLLAGAVVLVLFVAGVNVANLLLVRGIARRRELAVRAAIGAGRGRIQRQLATEAFVLVSAGALLGIVVAYGALQLLLALAPAELPRLAHVVIDGRALAFTAAMAVMAAIVFGMLPAVGGSRATELALRAREHDAEPGVRGHSLRHVLVVAQIAMTALVLSTAGLLLRSFDRMLHLDLGFTAQGVALVEVEIPGSRYQVDAEDPREAAIASADLHQRNMMRLAEHTAALPGVTSATAVVTHPFAGNGGVDALWYGEGQAPSETSNPYSNYEGVDAAYFETMDLPILRGRGIDSRDGTSGALVVVVNESFADLYWPGEDVVGRRIKGGGSDSPTEWRTVVGVVADTRYRELIDVRPTVYVPYEQGIPVTPRYIGVRTAAAPGAIAPAIRQLFAQEEPTASVVAITPLPRLLAEPLARPRFQSALVTSFALLGVALSAIGTYGVLAFFVRQRSREIGIRMALGANPTDVRSLVFRQSLGMGGLGVLIGIAAAVALGRVLDSLLFGVSATDPTILVLAAATLLVASFAAAALPTRTATRTDPMVVIRSD